MLEAIVAILAGLLLLSGVFSSVRGLKKVINVLKPFETVIGVVILILGILSILSLEGIAFVAAGLVLALSALSSIPEIGDALASAGRWLNGFRVVIGVIVLVIGILGLF